MKRVMVIVLMIAGAGVALETRVMPREGYGPPDLGRQVVFPPSPTPTRIDGAPDSRSIMGSSGKNICGDTTGLNVAVIYGATSGNPDNIFQIKIAYSTNQGVTWRIFGPFSGTHLNYRRCYSGIDARPYYWINNEVIHAVWHEAWFRGGAYVESSVVVAAEGTFPSGAFQLRIMPHTGDPEHNCWSPCIAVAPDNPNRLVVTAVDYNFALGGGSDIYAWYSTDGGYTWSQPILIVPAGQGTNDAPHFRFGTGGYGFAYFNRDTVVGPDTLMWPYCVETTDYGETWTQPKWMQVIPWPPYPQYSIWWYDYDCEVVSNAPCVVMTPGVPGVGTGGVEFWKGSGPVGNRTWRRSDLALGDSGFSQPSVVTGKDFARGGSCIGVIAGQYGNARLWHSTDLGASWVDRGALGGAVCEYAHVVGRGTNPLTDAWVHGIYFLTNAVYYDGVNIPNFFLGIEEERSEDVRTFNLTVVPNPFTRRATIAFLLPQPDNTDVAVYNAAGSRVATLVKGAQTAGLHRLVWPGTDDRGRPLPAGTYFICLATPNERRTQKVVLRR